MKGLPFHRLGWICVLVLFALTGCSVRILPDSRSTTVVQLTQVAGQVARLRQDLAQIAPTLTALVKYSTLAVPTSTGTQVVVDTAVPASTKPGTSVVPAGGSQATMTPTLVLPSSTLPPKPTLTPRPFVVAPSLTPWIIPATPPASKGASATQSFVVVNGRLDINSPTPFEPASSILYEDDFSHNRGWFTTSGSRYTLAIQQGKFHFQIAVPNSPIWSVRSLSVPDVRLEVDAAQLSGPADAYYGLVCRQLDEKNYYMLVVSVDGAFGIGKVKDKELKYLAFTDQHNNLLQPVGNRLRADCIGDTLALYIDGVKVLETQDAEFTSGAAGLVAGNRDATGIDVLFDNYIVLKP